MFLEECFAYVGMGSIRGLPQERCKNTLTLAFVGKGVTSDTGGISLKPAKFMEDMTYDMAGVSSCCWIDENFALRKAKIKLLVSWIS